MNCTHCNAPNPQYACGRCKRAYFCNEICQQAQVHRCIHNHYQRGAPVYVDNIEWSTMHNDKQLDIVYEGPNRLQVGLSSVQDRIPWETHTDVTQFFRVEEGWGELALGNGNVYLLGPGEAAVIPAGMAHEIRNTGPKPLKLYSVYAKDSLAPTWKH